MLKESTVRNDAAASDQIKPSRVICPFCGDGEDGIEMDLIGLKAHLQYDCQQYRETEGVFRPFFDGVVQP